MSLSINWNVILENFIAGAAVASLFGIFLSWLVDWQNRPKLQLIINLEDPLVGTNIYWISIRVANQGKRGFDANDIVWHIYWPHIFTGGYFIDKHGRHLPRNIRSFEKVGESNIHGQRHSHFERVIDINVAPGKEVGILCFRLPREFSEDEISVPYQFSTASKGPVPKRIWRGIWWFKIDGKDNFPRLELLPFAEVRDIRNSRHRGTSFIPPEDMSNEWF